MQGVKFVIHGHPEGYNRDAARLRFTPRVVTEWRNKVKTAYWEAVKHLPPVYFGEYRGLVAVEAIVYGSRADVDNALKEVLDGLKGGPFVDDRQVCRAVVAFPTRALGKGGGVKKPHDDPRAEVTIEFLDDNTRRAA